MTQETKNLKKIFKSLLKLIIYLYNKIKFILI